MPAYVGARCCADPESHTLLVMVANDTAGVTRRSTGPVAAVPLVSAANVAASASMMCSSLLCHKIVAVAGAAALSRHTRKICVVS